MGKINWFRQFLKDLVTEITKLKSQKLVIDQSTLTKRLDAHQTDNNLLLVGVMPDFSGKGTSADDVKLTAYTQLMVLKKTSYSEINEEEFLDIFNETYEVLEEVLINILNKSMEGCNELRFINVSTLKIVPVWNLHSCNGCKVMLDFDMSL